MSLFKMCLLNSVAHTLQYVAYPMLNTLKATKALNVMVAYVYFHMKNRFEVDLSVLVLHVTTIKSG